MRSKKVLSVFISLFMLILICCSSFVSTASFFVVDGDVVSCPGNTKTYVDKSNYNYAWLDSVVVRDGSAAVTQLTLYPECDYPYSHTCAEFIEDCNNYVLLFKSSDVAVEESMTQVIQTVYYTLVASGQITDPIPDMRAYNEENGIVYPCYDDKLTDVYTVIAYAGLKRNICKLVTNEDVTITRGTSVEGAVVKMLATVCNMDIPSSIDTVSAFSYLFTKEYVIEDNKYPISRNPSEDEVCYWAKLQAAEKAGYAVDSSTPYSEVTPEQMEYVTYAYYASVLSTRYGIGIDPAKLKTALISGNSTQDVPRLVLMSMLDNVSITYSNTESTEELFDKTLKEGYFALEDEFYSDVYNYKMYVPSDCEKIWITAFPIAESLTDATLSNVTTYLNETIIANKSTNPVTLKGDSTTFTISSNYTSRNHRAVYTFTVIRTGDAAGYNKTPSIDLSDPVNEIANNVSNILNGAVSSAAENVYSGNKYKFDTELTTYAIDDNSAKTYSGFSFETYPTDSNGEVLTTSNVLEITTSEETSVSVLNGVAETVKENPAVVAAPVGLIAVGTSFGFLFYYKRKDEEPVQTDDTDE